MHTLEPWFPDVAGAQPLASTVLGAYLTKTTTPGAGMYSVDDFMTRSVVKVDANDALATAQALWRRNRIRHLPVMEGGRLVGLVTPLDAATRQLQHGSSERPLLIRDAMSSPVHQVRPGTALRRAAEMMLKHQIGCVAVTDRSGALAGLLTKADLVRFALDMITDLDQLGDGLRRGAELDEAAAG